MTKEQEIKLRKEGSEKKTNECYELLYEFYKDCKDYHKNIIISEIMSIVRQYYKINSLMSEKGATYEILEGVLKCKPIEFINPQGHFEEAEEYTVDFGTGIVYLSNYDDFILTMDDFNGYEKQVGSWYFADED